MNLKTFYPPYFVARLAQMRFQAVNPTLPWLCPASITALQDMLKPDDIGYEFGSGRSTVWFAGRVRFLYSTEHDPEWYERVRDILERENLIGKVNYQLAPGSKHLGGDDRYPNGHAYVRGITELPDGSLDLRSGGILVLDNAQRYVPNKYQEGYTTVIQQRSVPRDEEWGQTLLDLSNWRGFNATDLINDTRFWIKP